MINESEAYLIERLQDLERSINYLTITMLADSELCADELMRTNLLNCLTQAAAARRMLVDVRKEAANG